MQKSWTKKLTYTNVYVITYIGIIRFYYLEQERGKGDGNAVKDCVRELFG